MQKILQLVLFLALAFILAACSSSHRPQQARMNLPVVQNPAKRLHVLKERLNLTEEQAASIQPILVQEYQKKTELISRMSNDCDGSREVRQELEDLEWSVIKRLSDHLTREQMAKYCDLLDEEQKQMQQGSPGNGSRGGGPGGGGPGGSGPGGSGRPGGSGGGF